MFGFRIVTGNVRQSKRCHSKTTAHRENTAITILANSVNRADLLALGRLTERRVHREMEDMVDFHTGLDKS